jgi:hypothetical protein
MRTEIAHHSKSGFLLSEQELRRLAQSCQEHAPRVGVNDALKIRAKLKDGTLVDSPYIDDILALENGGRRAITRLSLTCDDNHEDPKSYIKIEFENGLTNPASWDAASVSVVGESRDAAFIAAAELDDRVKKTQVRAWPYIVSRPAFL